MKPTKSYTVQEALQKVSRYCVYQDRCHQEVEQKLRSMNMIPEARAHIISELINLDFLNEERFALNFVRGKFNQKGWGRVRLRQELKRRRVTDYLIHKAIKQIEEGEYLEKLATLALKKFKSLGKEQSWSAKTKLKNHLIYKGYEIELIVNEINSLYKF